MNGNRSASLQHGFLARDPRISLLTLYVDCVNNSAVRLFLFLGRRRSVSFQVNGLRIQ